MSEINQKVKKLIAKAKESGDTDLLDLAMDLLDITNEDSIVSVKQAETPPEAVDAEPIGVVFPPKFAEFSMSDNKLPKPVEVKRRPNKFIDDGVEHKDDINKTPSAQLTERGRPAFKKVDQTCTRCNKLTKIHPQHVREIFVCDKCLRRR